jgi:hypothetical protein
MTMTVQKKGITFVGKVSDIIHLFDDYPSSITLLDYIRIHLH